ncbi:hypothetical protein AX14_009872 [Amanita brunnescens Koide BX004]|nr:hypothetical protein AX14_009872 [Amanita brunnescens Koide BX004]
MLSKGRARMSEHNHAQNPHRLPSMPIAVSGFMFLAALRARDQLILGINRIVSLSAHTLHTQRSWPSHSLDTRPQEGKTRLMNMPCNDVSSVLAEPEPPYITDEYMTHRSPFPESACGSTSYGPCSSYWANEANMRIPPQ